MDNDVIKDLTKLYAQSVSSQTSKITEVISLGSLRWTYTGNFCNNLLLGYNHLRKREQAVLTCKIIIGSVSILKKTYRKLLRNRNCYDIEPEIWRPCKYNKPQYTCVPCAISLRKRHLHQWQLNRLTHYCSLGIYNRICLN